MKRAPTLIATVIAGLALFAGGAWMLSRSDGPTQSGVVAVDTPELLVRDHSPVVGEADAPVTIVEFFDPACEACRAMYPRIKAKLAEHPQDIRLVLRYAAFHSNSEDVIRILEAARRQDLFEPVLEDLLDQQDSWAGHGAPDTERAWSIAAAAGLDLERARLDAVAPEVDAVLRQDAEDVTRFGVRSTPTFFVNGQGLEVFSPVALGQLIDSELAR